MLVTKHSVAHLNSRKLEFVNKYLPKYENIFFGSRRKTPEIDDVFANKHITSFTLLIRLRIKVWTRIRVGCNRQTARLTRHCKFSVSPKCKEEQSKNNVKELANCRCACKYNNFKWLAVSCATRSLKKMRIFISLPRPPLHVVGITIFINIMVRSRKK